MGWRLCSIHPRLPLLLSLLLVTGQSTGLDQNVSGPGTGATEIQSKGHLPLIPRQVLFGNPDRAGVMISPDGSRISFLSPLNGVLNVWVAPADDPEAAEPVTSDTYRGIRIHTWTYTKDRILFLQDEDGDENWRLYIVDLESNLTRPLTPEGVRAQIQGISHLFPEEVLVGLNDRDPRYHDVYRLNLTTGNKTLLQKNEGFAGFLTDDHYDVRLGARVTPEGGAEYLSPSDDEGWALFFEIGPEDVLTTAPFGFDKTGRVLYLKDSRNLNTATLATLDLDTGEETLLAGDQKADLTGVMIHPTEKNVQAAVFNYERKRWQVLDPSVEEDLAYLQTVADGDVEVVSRTLDDRTWIVAYMMDDGPVRYYLYNRKSRRATFLFTNRKDLDGLPLARMIPVVIKSRDGLDLVSYYTLPKGSDEDGDGRPNSPMPTVLLVHGGPWSRDSWGYSSLHQWLANRGYVVLSVNFRGSTGFGKDFLNAGNLEWGRRMQNDLVDAVNWAVWEGISDPERVAIMGGSYGGYATLVGLATTPETFACGVDIVGPSNLITLIETIPPYWEPQIEIYRVRMGDNTSEEGRALLRERSPLTHVDNITRPLLIGQGANDPRVKQNESDQIVRAMQEKEILVTYVLFSDEGHGFARPENRMAFYAVVDAFLSRCLGGRFEELGDDFNASTIAVPVGAKEVPGLKEALEKLG